MSHPRRSAVHLHPGGQLVEEAERVRQMSNDGGLNYKARVIVLGARDSRYGKKETFNKLFPK